MKKIYITFAGQAYDATIQHIAEDGQRFGADEVKIYDDLWLSKQDFYTLPSNRWLWKCLDSNGVNRGFGWYAFKPFIILHALENFCEPGDIVMYTDGDTYPIADFSMLYDECRKIGGIMLFRADGCVNRQWVKQDCWAAMGQFDADRHSQHTVARFMLFEKGPWRTQQFLMEWLTYCLNPNANTTAKSVLCGELPGFEEHRSDQSILSLLAIKYGIRLYREADEFGEASQDDRELYPRLFTQEYGHGPKGILGSRFANVA